MSDIVYVNEAEGIKRVMNNTKLYIKLLNMFKADTNLNTLYAYASVQDWEKAREAAHSLKGIAANLSLTELYNQSINIEAQLKAKSLDSDSLENLKFCFDETLAAVDRILMQNG